MGIGAAIFESAGKRSSHYVPGVYTRQKNISNPSGISSGNLCIIGQSAGGEPFKLLTFASIDEAKETLISGDLLKAVAYAFRCSKEGLAPNVVYAMRTNPATRATVELESISGEKTFIVHSADYGSQANQIKIYVDEGSEEGKSVTLTYKGEEYTGDNLIRKSFSIENVGDNNQVFEISKSKVTLKWTDDNDEQKVLDLDFISFPTLNELAGAINDTEYFNVELIDVRAYAASNELDVVSFSNLNERKIIYSNTIVQKEFIESVPFIGEVELKENKPLDNNSGVYFTGGSTSPALREHLNKALSVLETEDIQIIATPETSNEVGLAIQAHCESMSNEDNRKERTCILGGAIGLSDDDGIRNARAFNSMYSSYVIDNCIANNPITGKNETISGAMVGCMLAGIEAAIAVNIPLTKKKLNVLGCTKKRTITNMSNLIKNGIMVVNNDPENAANFICIRGLTTFQDDDLISCERSMVRESMFMARDLRQKTAGKVGDVGNGSSLPDIIQTLIDSSSEWESKGYIIPSDEGNVWDIRASINGDKVTLDYSVYLAAPINFIFITSNNHVYSASVTL